MLVVALEDTNFRTSALINPHSYPAGLRRAFGSNGRCKTRKAPALSAGAFLVSRRGAC